ncbi:hypothetical protein LOK49_LG12G01404 [Camellia lanceoleosa]|uniref:Uncharacterized protein n=1 Tax=Camellia lanceoleosa TaxID=1840588 RepID=A0ACC0FSC0_9ERIC|nr:hypothetical protein LOK49_LG12G01404 [Camellia lanceoleosa]
MSGHIREGGWIDSSDTKFGSEYSEERRDLPHPTFFRKEQQFQQWRGLRMTLSSAVWAMGNHRYCFCLVGYLLDRHQFVTYLTQHFIDKTWRAIGDIEVVGTNVNYYIFRFAREEDMHRVVSQGPYAIQGALLIVEY